LQDKAARLDYSIEDTEDGCCKGYKRWDLQVAFLEIICNMTGMTILVIIFAFFVVYAVLKFVVAGACHRGL